MLKSIITVLFVLLDSMAQAKQVPQSQARTVAQNFLRDQGNTTIKLADKAIVRYDENTGQPLIYVFTGAGNKGFVIVSADDQCAPILGYSAESEFVAKRKSPGTEYWMDGYGKQIKAVKKQDKKPTARIREQWSKYLGMGNRKPPEQQQQQKKKTGQVPCK